MELFDALKIDLCEVRLKISNKEELFEEIARRAESKYENSTAKEILAALNDREEQGSTGFGNGVAIPHARMANLENFVVFFLTLNKAIEFQAIDGKKVKLVCVILGPESGVTDHLKLLASISRIISQASVRYELEQSKSGLVLAETFLRLARQGSDSQGKVRKMKLLVLILYAEELLYHLLEYYLESGIEGATILDSSGMGAYISNIPVFADFISFFHEDRNLSKTIISLIPEDRSDDIIKGIQEITGDLTKQQGAMIFTVPIDSYVGTMKMV